MLSSEQKPEECPDTLSLSGWTDATKADSPQDPSDSNAVANKRFILLISKLAL